MRYNAELRAMPSSASLGSMRWLPGFRDSSVEVLGLGFGYAFGFRH